MYKGGILCIKEGGGQLPITVMYTCHSKADWRGGGGGFRGFHLRSRTFELVVMEDIMV